MNPRAYLAVRDLGGGVEVREIILEKDAPAAREQGYTLTPLVPVSGEPVAYMQEYWGPDCGPQYEIYKAEDMGWRDKNDWTPLFAHPPNALAAAQAEVKRLREALGEARAELLAGVGMEPVAFRVRYRRDPGMLQDYPWSYQDRSRRPAFGPSCETEGLYTADQLAAARAEQQWQPIATAPKDGTMFLCWVSAERYSAKDGEGSGQAHDVSQVDFCWWRQGPVEMPNAGYFDPACGQIGDTQDVTHWMPLPLLPSADAIREGAQS